MGRTDKEIYRVIDNVNSYYRITSESKKELLLNKYPNAAAAYSLRLLDGYYRGPLVRVRRDDGVEVDVYPDYNNQLSLDSLVTNVPDAEDTTTNPNVDADYTFQLSLSSLGEFVGATGYSSNVAATDATVCVWYDQANNNDATQTVAGSQPQIVTSGSIVVDGNGTPRISMLSSDAQMDIGNLNLTSASGFAVFEKTQLGYFGGLNAGQHQCHWGFTGGQIYDGFYNNTRPLISGAGTISVDTPYLISMFHNGTMTYNLNGAQIYSQSGVFTNATNVALRGSYPFQGYYSELIIYGSDQSSNRTGIEEDINSFYQIDGYTPTPKLIDLTQDLAVENGGTIADGTPAAAYSLRLLSSTYNGPLVRIRRTIDNTEVDVYPDSDGEFSIYSTIQDGGTELTTGVTGGSTDKTTLHEFLYGQDTDCMVVVWYDQAGANDATQTTTSLQPQIVASGSVITDNVNPALSFDGNNGLNVTNNLREVSGASSVFAVYNLPNNDQRVAVQFYKVQRHLLEYNGSQYGKIGIGTNETGGEYLRFPNASMAGQGIYTAIWDGSTQLSNVDDVNFYENGIEQTPVVGASAYSTTTSGNSSIGYNAAINAQKVVGKIQEVIVYLSDQSSNRAGIEQNINQHYNIY